MKTVHMIAEDRITYLYNQCLLKMCHHGDSVEDLLVLLQNSEINCINNHNENRTPLLIVTSRGYTDFVQVLLDNGADVDKADIRGITPLVLACSIGALDLVKLFIDAQANVNTITKYGATPLLIASYSGDDEERTEIIKLLVQNGGDIFQKDYNGDTVLSLAKKKNHAARIKFFLDILWKRRKSLYLMRLWADHHENIAHSPTILGMFLVDKNNILAQDIRRKVAAFL